MTGLDLALDDLIEVAVVITNYDLEPVHDGFSIVIAPTERGMANMSDFVREMHASSGLLDELPQGVPLEDAQAQIMAYLTEHVPTAGQSPLAGNTIGTDRAFIARSLPQVDAHLHYRSVNVSSHQGARASVVPPHLLQRAREGRRAPGHGRHSRVDSRTRLLPQGGVRRRAGAQLLTTLRRSRPTSCRSGSPGCNTLGRQRARAR